MRRAAVVPILLALLASCGPKPTVTPALDRALATALAATDAARDSFVQWDEDHQLAIVEGAETREEAETHLRVYRVRRAKALHAFTAAYQAIASAAALLPLIERGEKRDADLQAALLDAIRAVTVVRETVKELRDL